MVIAHSYSLCSRGHR